jgi:deazaflavin-dependent oxidoreductase (nitroreductase family)
MAEEFHDPWVAPALERGDLGILETTGARTGRARRTHTGFARRADGSLVVGAAHASTQWPHNLAARPRCRYAVRGVSGEYDAVEVAGEARDAALRDLEAVYGGNTPRGGRTFVLLPVAGDGGPVERTR